MRWILVLVSRLVPRDARPRWLEEWRAEIQHGRWTMVSGALPDAWAMRRLGQPQATRHASAWRGPWQTDLRQTLRSLLRSPWHVLTVTLCLGIGMAVSVAAFSIFSSILTGELPGVADRARLMRVHITTDEGWGPRSPGNASLGDYDILRTGTPHLPEIAAEGSWQFAVRTATGPSSAVQGAFVSGNYFSVLGTQPALGRLLTPDDERAEAAPAVVLSHAFWSAQLGAPADIVGSTITIGGRDALVVGVAPAYFSGTDVGGLGEPAGLRFRIYVPISLAPALAPTLNRGERWLTIVARTTTDRSREELAAQLQPLATATAWSPSSCPCGRTSSACVWPSARDHAISSGSSWPSRRG